MVVFLTLDICRKLTISVITSSQWIMSLVSIFWVTWRKVMQTCEAPDFWGLHKNKNCSFPLKKTQTQVLSCEICKLFNNNYFEEHLWTSVSKLYLKRDSNTGIFLWILWIIQEHLFCRGSTNGWPWNTSAGVSL